MRSENTVTRDVYMYIFGSLLMIVLNVSQDLTLSKCSRRHVCLMYEYFTHTTAKKRV